MQSLSEKSVLFAVNLESKRVFIKAIPALFQTSWCSSVEEAQSQLQTKFDLIVICTYFDSSRMFDLLRYCKSVPEISNTPVLCIRALGGAFEDTAFQGVDIASKALGAVAFIDLIRIINELGRDQAMEKLETIFAGVANMKPEWGR